MEHRQGNTTTEGASFSSQRSFDTNMVIILAALLCALVCALGVNSLLRFVFRCGRRFSRDRSPTAGLKKHELSQIPVEVYAGNGEPTVTRSSECAICLGEFAEGDKIRVLPRCKHVFHVRCIDKWLMSHSSCPYCRHSVLQQQQLQESSGGSGQRDRVVVVVEGGGS